MTPEFTQYLIYFALVIGGMLLKQYFPNFRIPIFPPPPPLPPQTPAQAVTDKVWANTEQMIADEIDKAAKEIASKIMSRQSKP